MMRILLFCIMALLATPAFADKIDSFTWNPITKALNVLTHQNGTKAVGDYQEGPFTPTLTCASGAVTYNQNVGAYVRVGRSVTANAYINWAKSTCSGAINGDGFPFAAKSSSGVYGSCAVSYVRGITPPGTYGGASTNTYGSLQAYIQTNTIQPQFIWTRVGATTLTFNAADTSTPNEIIFSCAYVTN